MHALLRRLRYGRPIVVVSGLPRSGTSMMMRMLEAGGVAPVTDGVRAADDSNPKGYFEFEPVKGLDKDGDRSWLPAARGRAVKIISFLLTWLPEDHNYAVIFMHRHPDEIIASQQAMLRARGEAVAPDDAARSREVYAGHLAQVERFMAGRECFRVLPVHYHDVIAAPEAAARDVARFLGRRLDTAAMTRSVERQLYRHRVDQQQSRQSQDLTGRLGAAQAAAPVRAGMGRASPRIRMPPMSTRVSALVGVVVLAAAGWWWAGRATAPAGPGAAERPVSTPAPHADVALGGDGASAGHRRLPRSGRGHRARRTAGGLLRGPPVARRPDGRRRGRVQRPRRGPGAPPDVGRRPPRRLRGRRRAGPLAAARDRRRHPAALAVVQTRGLRRRRAA